jgi:hypothetical protein
VPLPVSLLVAFALGAAFALASKAELARHDGPLLTSRAAGIVTGFALLVFMPVTAYFAIFHGDWAYLYLVAWRSVPSAVDMALVLAAGACVIAGFAAGVPAARARATRGMAMLIGAPLSAALLVVALCARRLMVSASYAQFHGAFGVEPVAATSLGKGILWSLVALVAGIAWTLRSLRAANIAG